MEDRESMCIVIRRGLREKKKGDGYKETKKWG